jgi:hypothetical protein
MKIAYKINDQSGEIEALFAQAACEKLHAVHQANAQDGDRIEVRDMEHPGITHFVEYYEFEGHLFTRHTDGVIRNSDGLRLRPGSEPAQIIADRWNEEHSIGDEVEYTGPVGYCRPHNGSRRLRSIAAPAWVDKPEDVKVWVCLSEVTEAVDINHVKPL